jgi:hypothetical protein
MLVASVEVPCPDRNRSVNTAGVATDDSFRAGIDARARYRSSDEEITLAGDARRVRCHDRDRQVYAERRDQNGDNGVACKSAIW